MEELKSLRLSRGLSQADMAQELGVSLSLYVKVEQGTVPASRAFMEKFKCRFPHESIDFIFFHTISDNIAVCAQ